MAPLQGVPYAEQLRRKRDAMRAELAQLPALLRKEAAHVGAAQLPAWQRLACLDEEALDVTLRMEARALVRNRQLVLLALGEELDRHRRRLHPRDRLEGHGR